MIAIQGWSGKRIQSLHSSATTSKDALVLPKLRGQLILSHFPSFNSNERCSILCSKFSWHTRLNQPHACICFFPPFFPSINSFCSFHRPSKDSIKLHLKVAFVWKLDVHFFSPLPWKPGESNGKVRTDWTHFDYTECVFMLHRESNRKKQRERGGVCLILGPVWLVGWGRLYFVLDRLSLSLSLGLFWLTAPCCLSRMSKGLVHRGAERVSNSIYQTRVDSKTRDPHKHAEQQGYWTVAMQQACVCVRKRDRECERCQLISKLRP